MQSSSHGKGGGVALVALASSGLALKGIWARLAYAEGTEVLGVLFYRSLLAAPLLVAVGLTMRWRAGRREPTPGEAAPPRTAPTKSAWRARLDPQALGLGVLFCVCMVTDFQAIAHLGAGLSRVILFGFPLVVMLLEAFVRGMRPTMRQLGAFVLAWVGLALVAAPPQGGHSAETWCGIGWAGGAVLSYGFYTWASAGVSRRLGSVRFTVTSTLVTSVCIVSYGLLVGAGRPPAATPAALQWLSLMVLVSTVIPYFLMFEGMVRAGATQASLVAMLGPVVTLVASHLFLGETYSAIQVLGAAIVVLSVASLKGDWPAALQRLWSAVARRTADR